MPPTAPTISNSKTAATYRIRTMAADIEALKKGQNPAGSTVALEPLKEISVPVASSGLEPENKKESRPTFPEIIFNEPPKIESPSITPPFSQIAKKEDPVKIFEFNKPPPQQAPQPFSGPITQPFKPQNTAPVEVKPKPFRQKMEPLSQQNNTPTWPPPPRPTAPPSLPPLPPLPPRPSWPPRPPLPTSSMGNAPLNLPANPTVSPVGSPTLPPLPPLPAMSDPKTKKKGLIVLVAGAALVIIFIVGEIWWFFLKPQPAVPTTPTNQTDLLPPPQELQPLLPPENSPTQPTAPEITAPQALLNYDRTETITVETLTPANINSAIKGFDTTSLGEEELVHLIIKTASPDTSTVSPNQTSTDTTATLDNITAGLKIKIASGVKDELTGDYDFFIYGASAFDKATCSKNKNMAPSCSGPRWGLALKTNGETKINSAVKLWEKTMISDLKNLVSTKISGTGQFQTGTYNNQAIRYKNLPTSATTIEYSLDNDILIIGTSKSSTLKALDALE